jgi:hypothetical protein
VSISRRYIDTVNEIFPGAEAFLARQIDTLREKEKKRRVQRDGNREPTGNQRGRPRLTPEAAAEAKEKRREYRRLWMADKRSAQRRLTVCA